MVGSDWYLGLYLQSKTMTLDSKLMTKRMPRNLLSRLEPLPGKECYDLARRVFRPYYKLSAEACAMVEKLSGKSDVLLFDGKTQVTWGDADGGKALMPLNRPI